MAEKSSGTGRRDFRQEATDLIVDMLEKGTSPWQRPWDKNAAARQLDMPHNGVTGRPYSGGNALFLMAKGMQKGYDDPRWVTYSQAEGKGWQVRRHERHGCNLAHHRLAHAACFTQASPYARACKPGCVFMV